MIRVKMLALSEVCIIEDLRVMVFDHGGTFKLEEKVMPKYSDGMIELPIISVLSSGGKCEVAMFHEGGQVTKFDSTLDSMTSALALQSERGFVRMLRRDGKEQGVRFNQLIFVYPNGTDLNSKVRKIRG